jgi:hypothetical protein
MEMEIQRSSTLTTQRARRESPEPRRPEPRRPEPRRPEPEVALRLDPDGIVRTIPLTREILLNPTLDIQVAQNPPHDNKLHGMNVRLRPFLRAQGFQVHSDVMLKWPKARDVSPDISVLENLREREPGEKSPLSLNIAAEGCRVRVVFELISPGAKERWKDEIGNPPFFAQHKVDYCVLVYPREYRKPTDPPLRVFANPTPAGYTQSQPDPQGFFLLQTIGVKIGVKTGSDAREEIVLLDATTGKVLPNVEEETERADQEAEARRQAELKTEQAELKTEQEADARRKAEQMNEEMMAELKRLRARLDDEGEA